MSPGMYSSGMVVKQIKTKHQQFKDKEKERATLSLQFGGIITQQLPSI